MNMMNRTQQSRIFATLKDIAYGLGENYPEIRKCHMRRFTARLKDKYGKEYWGDQEGQLSLKMGECTEKDATLFYYYLLDIALENGIQLEQKPT